LRTRSTRRTPRNCPPQHQACQHSRHGSWPRQGSRFGLAKVSRPAKVGLSAMPTATTEELLTLPAPPSAQSLSCRRASPRRRARRAHRSVFIRLSPLRNGHGTASIPGKYLRHHHRSHLKPRANSSGAAESAIPAQAGRNRHKAIEKDRKLRYPRAETLLRRSRSPLV